MNDVDFLGEKITDDVIEKFNEALEGIVEPGHSSEDMREVLLQRTQRFHHVQLASQLLHDSNETVEFYECDCRGYFYWRWCMHAAYMQHNDSLDNLGEEIQKKYSRKSKSKWKIAMGHKISLAEKRLQVGNKGCKGNDSQIVGV